MTRYFHLPNQIILTYLSITTNTFSFLLYKTNNNIVLMIVIIMFYIDVFTKIQFIVTIKNKNKQIL